MAAIFPFNFKAPSYGIILGGLCLSWLGYSPLADASELKWTYYGLRPLAMGNAFVSVVDDHNALFYNPAGLARLKSWDGEILNPRITVSKNTVTFINDAMKLSKGDQESYDEAIDLLASQSGKNQYFAIGLAPHLIFPGFGFGLGAEVEGSMSFHRYPTVEIDLGPRVILPVSLATSILEDRLSFGITAKARLKGGVNHEFSIQDLDAFQKKNQSTDSPDSGSESTDLSEFIEGGIGYGDDVGMLFTPVEKGRPTLGISITDAGSTPYRKINFGGAAVGTPKIQHSAVNVGMSFRPLDQGERYFLLSADMHAINQPLHFSKKLNFGGEWGISSIVRTQFGLHQGIPSFGVEIDVGLLNARFVTYGTELGPVAGTASDRRYMMQIKFFL